MKNLNNFNHWIAAIREEAYSKLSDKMSTSAIKKIFCKYHFYDYFRKGLSPEEAFEEEMEVWATSQ